MSNLRRQTSDLRRALKNYGAEKGQVSYKLRPGRTAVNGAVNARKEIAGMHKRSRSVMGRKKYSQHLRKNHMAVARKHL